MNANGVYLKRAMEPSIDEAQNAASHQSIIVRAFAHQTFAVFHPLETRAVDSTPATPLPSTGISSPGAEGVASKDSDDGEGVESSGGSRSLASVAGGAGGAGSGKENYGSTHVGAAGSILRAGKADHGPRNGLLVRPPSPISGGYAAAQA